MTLRQKEERLLREWVRERSHFLTQQRSEVAHHVLRDRRFSGLVLEMRLLLEEPQSPAASSENTVGAVLAALDDRVSEMDTKLGEFIQALIKMAAELSPEEVKKKIEAVQKDVKDYQKDTKDIQKWCEKLVELVKATKVAWDKSKSEQPDSLKKRLMFLFSTQGKVLVETFKHVMSMKDLYQKNDLFKHLIASAGFNALKELWATYKDDIVNLIGHGTGLSTAWKIVKGIMSIGGKVADLFKKAKEANASPQDKLAAVTKQTIKGKDEKLGILSKILQLDDDLEAVLDDKLEAKFIDWYTGKLRELPPSTPLKDVDANKLLTDFVKGAYGKSKAHVGLAGGES